jgi:hypothetical protein
MTGENETILKISNKYSRNCKGTIAKTKRRPQTKQRLPCCRLSLLPPFRFDKSHNSRPSIARLPSLPPRRCLRRPPASSSMASTCLAPASLSTPLLSDSIARAPAANGLATNHRHHHDDDSDGAAAVSVCDDGGGDPFAFLSEDRPPRDRGPSPADPFRNGTPAWGGGVYAWSRTLLLLPVALVRLALFGLSIAIGYAATWVALRGWADTHGRPRVGGGPMPAWRRRLMWITRISARCILFSFG